MADCLLSLKALLGFGGFSAGGLGNQIQEYQRLFADIFERMGLAGAGDGNVAGATSVCLPSLSVNRPLPDTMM